MSEPISTLLGFLVDNLTGRYIRTDDGWKQICDVTEGHRVLYLVLEGGDTLTKSPWAVVEIADVNPETGRPSAGLDRR